MRSTRRTRGVAVAVAAVALLAACGDTGGSTTTVATGPAGASTAPAAGNDAAVIAAAQAVVDKALAPPTSIRQTVPLTGKVEQGRTYVFLQCEIPQCKAIGDGAVAAAQAIGWKTEVLPWKTSDPATLVTALKDALRYNPIAVTPTGFPEQTWASVLPAYKKAGALIVPASVAELKTDATTPMGASMAPDYIEAGNIIANWFIADSQATGKALFMDVPAYGVLKAYGDAAKATIAKICAACEVTPLDITIPQLSSNGVVPAIVSALQKDKDIKYVLTSDGAFLNGLPSALKAAGIDGIKIGGGSPNIINKQGLVDGTESAWTDEPIKMYGWVAVDIAARASLGMPIAASGGGRTQQLLLKSNVGTPTDSLNKPADFSDQFKKLWGL